MKKTNPKQPLRRSRWILTAAAALAALGGGVSAFAQVQQKPTDGRALDANNRIGSGGTNTYRPPAQAGVFGNQIITGDVTAGKEFHGRIDYTDSTAFRGPQPRNTSDDFVKNSIGVGVPNTPPAIPNASEPYYTANRFAPPPLPGYVPNATAPGYVQAEPLIVKPYDSRLGAQIGAEPATTVPKAGEMLLPGPVDPTSQQPTLLSASPLTGIRQFNPSNANDLAYLNSFTGLRQDSVLDRAQIGVQDFERMREELRTANAGTVSGAQGINGVTGINGVNGAVKIDTGNPATVSGGGGGTSTLAPDQNLARPVGQPFDAPADPRLSQQPLNSALASSPLPGTVGGADQGQYSRLLGAPEKQSAQYDELKKRLQQYQVNRKTAAQKGAEQFNAAMAAKKAAEDKAAAAAKQNPDEMKLPQKGPVNPNQQPATPPEQINKPSPLSVKSMASGVKAQGLKDVLAKAEALLKDGKYSAAIDEYAAAEQVAPNQPLIWVGRANAELGAAYYKRAEDHLKQAFTADQALLMAQYDLRSFLGEDRLQSIIKDLKEVASTDEKSPTPVFLLAYVAYNTGNERRAAAYLDLAEKRSNGKDPIYKLLREHWSLPPAGTNPAAAPGDENKTPDAKELNK